MAAAPGWRRWATGGLAVGTGDADEAKASPRRPGGRPRRNGAWSWALARRLSGLGGGLDRGRDLGAAAGKQGFQRSPPGALNGGRVRRPGLGRRPRPADGRVAAGPPDPPLAAAARHAGAGRAQVHQHGLDRGRRLLLLGSFDQVGDALAQWRPGQARLAVRRLRLPADRAGSDSFVPRPRPSRSHPRETPGS